jgi:hypothetical protein
MATGLEQWVTGQDGLDNLRHIFRASGSVPQPGKDEVLVRIKAVSLNYRDTEGNMPMLPFRMPG